MNPKQTEMVSRKLTVKIILAVSLIMVLAGISYVLITIYFTNIYFLEASQRLNGNVANHLIDEKFKEASPFLPDGSPNKALFGDIMHDMMAVNRSIEVYLLDKDGHVKYSVVLDHSNDSEDNLKTVDLQPIHEFISGDGQQFILGDDPQNPTEQNIFSAATFDVDGNQGYIYIILAGKAYTAVNDSLLASYFFKLGGGATLLTVLLSIILGGTSIWYLTKNLREIIYHVQRFKDGQYDARVPDAEYSDLNVLAVTFNDMANTIESNIRELESIESLRRELTANVSHDLRTPLAIIKGYVETLQIKWEKISQEEAENYLSIVNKSLDKLTHLVNQLFEYSKLEAKQIEPVLEPFHIGELASDIQKKYQILADEQQIALGLDISKDTPLVYADISLVERAIQNLMDNALRYTPPFGKVVITANSNDRNVEIAIKDTGPGIPENEQSFIFERYKKTSNTKINEQGAGIGLAIVKKIMDLHKTTIKVISKPNEGTIFQFNLPAYGM